MRPGQQSPRKLDRLAELRPGPLASMRPGQQSPRKRRPSAGSATARPRFNEAGATIAPETEAIVGPDRVHGSLQ